MGNCTFKWNYKHNCDNQIKQKGDKEMQALIPVAQSFVVACWVVVGIIGVLALNHLIKRK